MKEIPILIDGNPCGSVRMQRQGAYILCTGHAQGQHELVRLWLYGTGTPEYLGVLIPDDRGGSSLRKKFSLAEFSRLPDPITHCAPQEVQTESAAEPERNADDVLWYLMGDGTLTARIGNRQFLAFPAENVRIPRGAQGLLREIEGRQYIIFPA